MCWMVCIPLVLVLLRPFRHFCAQHVPLALGAGVGWVIGIVAGEFLIHSMGLPSWIGAIQPFCGAYTCGQIAQERFQDLLK